MYSAPSTVMTHQGTGTSPRLKVLNLSHTYKSSEKPNNRDFDSVGEDWDIGNILLTSKIGDPNTDDPQTAV